MGAARGPGSRHRRGRGIIRAAVTPSCTPIPRPERLRGSAGSMSPPASVPSRVGGWGHHFTAPQLAAAPGPWVEGWGEGRRGPELEWSRDWSPALPAPLPPSPRSSWQRAVTASGGTWDQVHSPEAGAAAVGEGPSPGRPDLARPPPGARPGTSAARGSFAEQTRMTRGRARSPPCPGVLPRGRGCTQSRVCLAWERCP